MHRPCGPDSYPPPPRVVSEPSHKSELNPSECDKDGRKPDSSATPLEVVDNAHALEEYDNRPKSMNTDTLHISHTLALEEDLENDTQKQLDDLLALWTPIPQVGEQHSQVE